jgi:tetratricopeptide (TPR) repeat protein
VKGFAVEEAAKHSLPAFRDDSTIHRHSLVSRCGVLLCFVIFGLGSNTTMRAKLLRMTATFLGGIVFCFSIPFVLPAQDRSDFSTLAEAARKAREDGNLEGAISLYRQAVHVRSEWAEGWWYLGTLLYDVDRFAEAVPALRKVTELAPELGAAWSFLGLSEFETKDYFEALGSLEKGVGLANTEDPEIDRVAKFHLALLKIRSGEFEQAQKLLIPQFTSSPVSDHARTALGLLLLRVPVLPRDVEASRDGLISAAGDLQLQVSTGKQGDGLLRIRSLLSRNASDPVAHEILARCYDALHMATESARERAQSALSSRETSAAIDKEVLAFFSRHGGGSSAREDTPATNGNPAEFESLSRSAAAAQRAGNPATAIPLYEKALQLNPDWSEGRWALSMEYYSSKRFSDAIASLKIWLERNPNSGTAWAVLGLSEFEMHDYDNALIHLGRGDSLGLKASAESVRNAHYHEAILLNRKSEFSRAAQILSAAAGPGFLEKEITFALGMSFLRIPQWPDDLLVARKPLVQRTGEAAFLLGDSKYDLALPKLKDLVRDFPQEPFLHYVYGSALSSLSMFDEAAAQFEAETLISPQSELPLVELALLNLQRHTINDAARPAERSVQLADSSPAAHYVLGRVYLELGRNDLALQQLSRAADLSPGSPEIHFQLARAYARHNLPEKAAAERALFARLNTLAEQQRSSTGSQSYGAVRQSVGASVADPESRQASPGTGAPPNP